MEALMLTEEDYIFVAYTDVGVRLELTTQSVKRVINHYDSFARVGKLGLTNGQVIFSDLGFTTHETKEDRWIVDFIVPAYFTHFEKPLTTH